MADLFEIFFRTIAFFIFLFFVVFINFLVFRNILYYFTPEYNWYAFLSALSLIFLVLFFFLLTHVYANILTIFLKRVINTVVGVFFIYFFIFIFLEVLRFLNFTNKIYFYVALVIGLLIVIYSVFNAFNVEVKNVELTSDKITKNYKIVLFSDLHIGSNSIYDLNKVIDIVNKQNPDMVLIPGDFIDEDYAFKEDLSVLKTINAKTYITYGNHEFYLKSDMEKELKNYSVIFLRNSSIDFNKELSIIGVDDNYDKLNHHLSKIKIDNSKYNLLLNHEPTGMEIANKNNIDLMVSGHTHNGQIFPFRYLVKLRYEYVYGLYSFNNTNLYVSSGAGTWGPKMRFGTNSEVVVITLKPKN